MLGPCVWATIEFAPVLLPPDILQVRLTETYTHGAAESSHKNFVSLSPERSIDPRIDWPPHSV